MRDFVVVRHDDPEFLIVRLTTIQLVAEEVCMGVPCVVPQGKETIHYVDLLLVGDLVPRADVVDENKDGEVFVPNVGLFFGFAILCVDRGNNELHADGVDCLMKLLLLEEELVGALKG